VSRVILFPTAEPVPDQGGLPSPLVALRDAVAGSRRRHRSLVVAAGRWALARGLSLPADHVALWAAAVEHSSRGEVAGVTGPGLGPDLHRFWSLAAGNWCALARCRPPADLTASLWHLYEFLAETGRLHPACCRGDPGPAAA
jgi:hypothetical protein